MANVKKQATAKTVTITGKSSKECADGIVRHMVFSKVDPDPVTGGWDFRKKSYIGECATKTCWNKVKVGEMMTI